MSKYSYVSVILPDNYARSKEVYSSGQNTKCLRDRKKTLPTQNKNALGWKKTIKNNVN